jgi:hypothetical protein
MKIMRTGKIGVMVLFVAINAMMLCACSEKANTPVVENYSPLDPAMLQIGDTVTPFRYINPITHDWRVVVRVSGEDLVDVSHKLHTRMFSTTDENVLKRLRNWKFVYKRTGVVNASSTVRVFKNDELEETYGIVLEKKWMGLQSKKFGLLVSVRHDELLELLKEMN